MIPLAPESVDNKTLQLELKAMRSEFRLWIVAAVVANTTIAHIVLPPAVGFASGGLLLAGVVVKLVLLK